MIVSIDHKAKSCVVRYEDYENEEEQNLRDLIPPAVQNASKSQKEQSSYYQVKSRDAVDSLPVTRSSFGISPITSLD